MTKIELRHRFRTAVMSYYGANLPECHSRTDEAMARLQALTVPPELIRIIERTVAIDPALLITRNEKKVEEIFSALEQVPVSYT